MFLLLQGWTPLHCAADTLHKRVVELLLKSCTQEALSAADIKVLLILAVLQQTNLEGGCEKPSGCV